MSEKQRTQGVKYEHYLLLIRGYRVKGARLQGKHTLVIYVSVCRVCLHCDISFKSQWTRESYSLWFWSKTSCGAFTDHS